MKAMPDDTRSFPDLDSRLEDVIVAFLECREKGEEPKLDDWSHDPAARSALAEMVEDEQELQAWFRPLAAVTRPANVGRLFGNYELVQLLGDGGQGAVYRARQVHINKEVALKLVNPHDRRRSLRELELAANLEHENLVRVYHVGEHDGQLYFTMQLAEKGSLAKHLDEYGLPTALAQTAGERQAIAQRKKKIAGFMARIARAVHYVHEQGIIHRDLKPANILIDAQGEPLVTDLGLARRIGDTGEETLAAQAEDATGTRQGAIVGTPGYMAPEQARGQTDLKPAVDLYGLGAILYELLTDRKPFMGAAEEVIGYTADLERLVPPPSLYNPNLGVGSDLDLICKECLAKRPEGRYASAAQLADDLERSCRGERISIRPRGWLGRAWDGVVLPITNPPQKPLREDLRFWSMIDLWDVVLQGFFNVAVYLLIRTDQSPLLLWLALLLFLGTWWPMFVGYLRKKRPLGPFEWDLIVLWGGVSAGGIVLFGVFCPPFRSARAADLLSLVDRAQRPRPPGGGPDLVGTLLPRCRGLFCHRGPHAAAPRPRPPDLSRAERRLHDVAGIRSPLAQPEPPSRLTAIQALGVVHPAKGADHVHETR
jgi:serine/threonine protein kinase